VRHGGFLRDAELFAHGFFTISAAEAAAMDPQQRQLLEHGYTALHTTGRSKASLLGDIIAVNVGQWQSEFGSVLLGTPAARSVYASTGFSCSVTCGRVSFTLGLQGPCASFDTACSASLVANHGSMRALQRKECVAALSAGVNMILDPATMRGNAVAGFTSVRGRSHTFDARADGYARGEAIGAVVSRLRELKVGSDTEMRGSAVRQDGRSASLTAPNGQAQQGVLGVSLADAQAEAGEVPTLEAHGTGTALGDPIEAGAVAAIFLKRRVGMGQTLCVGSLKANAGHTEPGAGLAGILKLQMQLQEARMSPNAHLHVLNLHVGVALQADAACGLPVQVSSRMSPGMCLGGVSSFGYAGTISHAVLAYGLAGDGQAVAFGSGKADEAAATEAMELHTPKCGLRGAEAAGGGVGALPKASASLRGVHGTSTHGVQRVGASGSAAAVTGGTNTMDSLWAIPTSDLLVYRRRCFHWCKVVSTPVVARVQLYAVCWTPSSTDTASQPSACLMLAQPSASSCNGNGAKPPWHAVGMLLVASGCGSIVLHGLRLAIALAQSVVARAVGSPRFLMLTCDVFAISCQYSASHPAHGGVWGFARVLRLEHPVLRTLSVDLSTGKREVTPPALTALTGEAEAAWHEGKLLAARLRPCTAFPGEAAMLSSGVYAVTGGLGGLGVRAAALAVEKWTCGVLLASRSGRVVRDGQGLETKLQSLCAVVAVEACDSADARDTSTLLSLSSLTGVLHAAGVGDKGLLVDLEAWRLQWAHTSKAIGAWHLHCASAYANLAACVLFSSVGSGLGNVGQASYAMANACLDAHASSQRSCGKVACSVQWPLVGGAGMGAAAFATVGERQVAIVGLAGISLEEYAACLGSKLAGYASAALSVQMAHRSDVERLLQDVADATQRRFSELVALVQRGNVDPVTPISRSGETQVLRKSASQLLAALTPSQHRTRIEASVLRTVRELMGAPSAALAAETPLMEAGVDSLAATELASRLRALIGVALSPTLVFEQPTPRAIAAHVLAQLACEARTAMTAVPVCPPCAGVPIALVAFAGTVLDDGASQTQSQSACDGVNGSNSRTQWALDEGIDSSADGEGGPRQLGARRVRVWPLTGRGKQQPLLLELWCASQHGTSRQPSTLQRGDGSVCVGVERPDWAHRLPPSARGCAYVVTGDDVLAAAGRVLFALGLEGPRYSLELAFGSGKEDGTPGKGAKEVSQAIAFGWGADPAGGGVGALPTTPNMVYRRLELGWCGPRHPFAYRNQPLSCNGDVIVRSPTVGLLHAVVADHIVQGRVIFPGAGYLEMARATGAMALHGIYFLQPLAIEGGSLFVECALSDGRFEVRSGANETIKSATVHCSGEVAGACGWWRIDHTPVRVCPHAADVALLYDGFDVVGLQYGPGYRTLLKAWGGGSNALARLGARLTQEGTQVHPADLDDAFCTSAAIAMGGGGETRLPFAVDDAQLQGALGKLWAVRFCSLR
jgi:3-oxoacyl-(acyl-carrier-protein) synthase/acyl carrier protein